MKCASGSMDRASDSGSEGWGFESLLAYQEQVIPYGVTCSYVYQEELERVAATQQT